MNEQGSSLKEQIWLLVATIPSGRVATYGQIARLAGYPSHARYVGATLKNLPRGTTLPWHRVVTSSGAPAFPPDSPGYRRQRQLLEAEQVSFSGVKVALRAFRWDV